MILGSVVGATARYGPRNPDPVRHVYTARPASRTGGNVRALCGRSILPYPWCPPDQRHQKPLPTVPFDPEHPRACRHCVEALRIWERRAAQRAAAAAPGPDIARAATAPSTPDQTTPWRPGDPQPTGPGSS